MKDGIIDKMFIEPEKPGDPFEVSDADTMLNYINPEAKKPDRVAIHSDRSRVVGAITGRGTVPQVFVNGRHIGGLEELQRWARKAA